MLIRKVYRHLIIWVAASIFIFLLPGCVSEYLPRLQKEKEILEVRPIEEGSGQWEEESPRPGVLYPRIYLVEGKGKYLLPVTVSLPWTEGVAKATLEKLIEGPTPAQEMRYGLHSPLPPNTRVRGLSIREGLAKVDLNAAFLDYNPGEEEYVLNSVLFTLFQFPSVKKVQLMVEGIVPEVFPGGTAVQETWSREEGINREEAEKEPIGSENSEAVTLYFCTVLGENNFFYVPVTRFALAGRDVVEATIEELFKGPRAGSSLFSDLPADVKLRGFALQEGILTVDFSPEILYYRGGRRGEKNMLMQIVLTLVGIPGVDKVQVLVDGEKMSLPYGSPCQNPLVQPLMVNPLADFSPDDVRAEQDFPHINDD